MGIDKSLTLNFFTYRIADLVVRQKIDLSASEVTIYLDADFVGETPSDLNPKVRLFATELRH